MSGESINNISWNSILQGGLNMMQQVASNNTSQDSIFARQNKTFSGPWAYVDQAIYNQTGIDINQAEQLAMQQCFNLLNSSCMFDYNGDGKLTADEDMSMVALKSFQESQKAKQEGRINIADTSYLPGEIPEGFKLVTIKDDKSDTEIKVLRRREYDYEEGKFVTKDYPYQESNTTGATKSPAPTTSSTKQTGDIPEGYILIDNNGTEVLRSETMQFNYNTRKLEFIYMPYEGK